VPHRVQQAQQGGMQLVDNHTVVLRVPQCVLQIV
jgi:hypothetical protein